MNQRTCPTCRTVFTPTHSRNIYCGVACRKDEHAKIAKTCDCCGTICMKAPTTRYKGTYCSDLCRDYTRWGALTKPLPSTHWARWYGATSAWVPPLTRNTGACTWCGSENQRAQTAAYCGARCKQRAKAQRRRAAEHGAPGEYTWREVMEQYRAQGFVCAYCGTKPAELPEPEHVVPLSKGGRNDMTNIVAACKLCNSDKRDLLIAEWNEDRARRGLAPVNTAFEGRAFLRIAA